MWGKRPLRAIVIVLVLLSASCVGGCSAFQDTKAITAVQDGTLPGFVHVTEWQTGRGLIRPETGGYEWVLDDRGKIVDPDRDAIYEDQVGPERTEACAGDDCYRVVPGQLRVETRHGLTAGYAVAWQVTGDTYRQLAHDHHHLGDPAAQLSSRSVVAHEVAGGHVVFVANGRDGVLYRDVRGQWHRLGIPSGGEGRYFEKPPRLATDSRLFDFTWYAVGVVVLAIAVAGAVAGVRRRQPWWRQGSRGSSRR